MSTSIEARWIRKMASRPKNKEANQAPEPTAPSGRGSSITFGKNKRMHWWIEWPQSTKRVVMFCSAMAALVAVCICLPAEVWALRWHVLRRTSIPAPGVMIVFWSAGWFAYTFVHAEDLNVLAPVNYQSGVRVSAIVSLAVGGVIAVFLIFR